MKNYAFVVGLTILFLAFAAVFLTSLVFLFGGHMSPAIAWVAIFFTVIFAFVTSSLTFKHYVLMGFVCLATIFGILYGSAVVNQHIYDFSYDGETYHQEAVIQLGQGWNPDYRYLDPNVIGLDQKWINYYPKSAWISEAYIWLLTGNLQTGKAMNIVFLIASLLLTWAAFVELKLMNWFNSLLVSILIAANPVNIYEMFTYYVDSQLITLLVALAALLIIFYKKKNYLALAGAFFAATLVMNIKFTGVVDGLLILTIFLVMLVRGHDMRLARDGIGMTMVAFVVGLFIMGFSPYVTNFIRYQTPFYPLIGSGAIDLKPYNVPGDYIPKNSLEIFFMSFFARSDSVRGVGSASTYKLPFTYNAEELIPFRYTDQQEGGFGPLFGGIVLVSAIIVAMYFVYRKYFRSQPREGTAFWVGIMTILFLIGMSIINPISSLARYVPQAYLIVIIPVIVLLSFRKIFPSIFAYLVIALLAYNAYLIGNTYIAYAISTSTQWQNELAVLAQESRAAPIAVHFNEFKSNRILFDEAGVRYVDVANESDCVNPKRLLRESTTEFCGVVQ